MHEVSLGGTIRDYLTGEIIDETTYEDLRQALARMLVEELGYPRESLTPRVLFEYTIEGQTYHKDVDLLISGPDGQPLMVVMFCPGEVRTYERETVSLGRIMDDKPLPLAICTDTMDASLMDVASGECFATGMAAVPKWEKLLELVEERNAEPLSGEAKERVLRIFHAYNGFHDSCCTNNSCSTSE